MAKLTVGTRGSALALRQTESVVDALKLIDSSLEIEFRIIKTRGDEIADLPSSKLGGKGLFVKEIEAAILRGEIDFAVHSMKDVPTEIPDGLSIAAVPERLDPRDALVSYGPLLAELPPHSRIGTSSPRRAAQLRAFRSDVHIVELRGNLDTRLRKLRAGELDAIIVAYAGLLRMGWADHAVEIIPVEVCVPPAGQGALAVESRHGSLFELLRNLNHEPSYMEVTAERNLTSFLGGGCQAPVGALARMEHDRMRLLGMVVSPDGSRFVRRDLAGNPHEAERLGCELAEAMLADGADEILRETRLSAKPCFGS